MSNGQKQPERETGFKVYHLEYTDGTIELGLSYVHRAYLNFLADHGGEQRFDYSKLTESQRAHIRELIKPLCLITEHESVGDRIDLVIHRLTDAGRNIATVIKQDGGP